MIKSSPLAWSVVYLLITHSVHLVAGEINDKPINNDNVLEEVLVTGSRIPNLDHTEKPNLIVIDKETLTQSAPLSMADILNKLPGSASALSSLETSAISVMAGGINTLNLRNLDQTRTLVLLNGRRLIGGDAENPTAVDLNTIPLALVDRVEILTGGTSAVYGSGAIAGVVNIITKTQKQGFELDTHSGITDEGDGKENSLQFSGGIPFADAKGQLLFQAGRSEYYPIFARDRSFSNNDESLGDFEDYSFFTPAGVIYTPVGFFTRDSEGNWDESYNPLIHGYNRADYRLLRLPLNRNQFNVFADYHFDDNNSLFFESSYSRSDSTTQLESAAIRGDLEPLSPDYVFLPGEILDYYASAGITDPGEIYYFKRFSELGLQHSQQVRTTARQLLGISHEVENWSVEALYQWSDSTFHQTSFGQFSLQALRQALSLEDDPENPGSFRCVNSLAREQGCAPVDLFGVEGISNEAVNYLSIEALYGAQFKQQFGQINFEGLGWTLPAGYMQWAFGIEQRKEELQTYIDPLTEKGDSSAPLSYPVKGSIQANEVFGELKLPLVNDVVVKNIDLNLAYRYSDYDDIAKISSSNIDLQIQMNNDFGVYFGTANAMRAPNITELFLPGRVEKITVADPCAQENIVTNSQTESHCQSLGIPSNFLAGSSSVEISAFQSGNPSLQEEKGKTFTGGFHFTPDWSMDLKIFVDYFDIEIEDAINLLDPGLKLKYCYRSNDFPNNSFCEGIIRTGVDNGFLFSEFNYSLENIASAKTSGVDFNIQLTPTVFSKDLKISILATHTLEWEEEANEVTIDQLGEPGLQKWKGHVDFSYLLNQWQLQWDIRYIGSGVVENDPGYDYIAQNNHVPAKTYHDFSFSYQLPIKHKNSSFKIYAGVRNLFDTEPPYISKDSRRGTLGAGTAAGVYDIAGRFGFIGLNFHL